MTTGLEFGYISQTKEPKVLTGWGEVVGICPHSDRAHVRWPNGHEAYVNLNFGITRRKTDAHQGRTA